MTSDAYRLLDVQGIPHEFRAFDCFRDFHGPGYIGLARNKTAQLDNTLECLDTDLRRLQAGLIENSRFDLCRNNAVINILACALGR